MRDRDRNEVRDTERTTIVHTDSGRGGSGGFLLAIVVLIALAALLFFLFGGSRDRPTEGVDIDVNIEAPELTVPDVQVPNVDVPDVSVNLPDPEPRNESEGNRSR